jgi:hypothetical protein
MTALNSECWWDGRTYGDIAFAGSLLPLPLLLNSYFISSRKVKALGSRLQREGGRERAFSTLKREF